MVFDEPLKDYVRLLASCKQVAIAYRYMQLHAVHAYRASRRRSPIVTCARAQAISTRDGALRAYNNASASVAAKKDKLAKLREGGKEDKASALQRELTEAEEQERTAKQEYETVAARLDSEMARRGRNASHGAVTRT